MTREPMFDFTREWFDASTLGAPRAKPPTFWRSLWQFLAWWCAFLMAALALGLASS